jgi:NAD(P)-dependent dehydrogenase (short-subunit alcohol dehydrogenase family)
MKKKWTTQDMPDQSGRIAIVTGANTGIGFETAKALAAAGAEVTLACRNATKGQDAVGRILKDQPGAKVSLGILDLSSLASVHDFAEGYRAGRDRLDLLINNAGVMTPPDWQATADGFELQFGTNHLGHFALTAHLWNLLAATEGARVVNVSSVAHRYAELDLDDLNWKTRGYKKNASYGQSKLANLLFSLELSGRVTEAGKGPMVVSAHPGWTATDLQRHNSTIRALNPVVAMQPWQGALPTLYAATAPDAQPGEYYGPHGFMEMRGYPVRVGTTNDAKDKHLARRLWEVSEEMTGVRFGA